MLMLKQCRFLYNIMLSDRIEEYRKTGKRKLSRCEKGSRNDGEERRSSCCCSKHFWAYTKKDTSLEKISWDFTVKQGILDVFCIYSKQNLSPDPEKRKILGLGSILYRHRENCRQNSYIFIRISMILGLRKNCPPHMPKLKQFL